MIHKHDVVIVGAGDPRTAGAEMTGRTPAPEVRDHRRAASAPAPAPAPTSPQQRQALLARTASAVTALRADGRLLGRSRILCQRPAR